MDNGAEAEGPPPGPSGAETTRAPRRWYRIAAVGLVAGILVAAIAVSLRPSNAGPTITSATVSADSTSVGTLLSFQGRATDPDQDALTYTWNFGDDSTATGANATHAYSIPGRFVALLRVTDPKGAEGTNDDALLFIEVRPRPGDVAQPPPPTADACPRGCTTGPAVASLVADQTTLASGTLVRFSANASWAYTWNWNNVSNHSEGGSGTPVSAADSPTLFTTLTYGWGDGSPSTGGDSTTVGTTSHRFSSPGNFFVRVTLTVPTVSGSLSVSAGYTVRVTPTAVPVPVKHPQRFTQVTFGEPESLDPAADAETSGGEILQNVYETLVWYEPGTDNVTVLVPRLAAELPTEGNGGISADGKNYTFTLRPNVKFHSGATMTADDVAYSIQRVLAAHDPAGPSWILEQVLTNFVARYVDGCGPSGGQPCTLADYAGRAFPAGAAMPPNIRAVLEGAVPEAQWAMHPMNESVAWAVSNSTVEAVGTDQVKVHLTRPYPAFLQAMASTVGSVVQKSCALPQDGWGSRNEYLDRQGDCGTGPYTVRTWLPDVVLLLARFDDYWGGPIPIGEVQIEKANDVVTREFMLLAGDADSASITRDRQLDLGAADGTPKYTSIRILKDRPTFDVAVFGYNQAINGSMAPDPLTVPSTFFADLHVRKAFSYAFDYDRFLRNVTHGTAIPLRGPIAQGIPGSNASTPVFTYNLSRAAAELQRTPFWTSGFNLTLYYNAGNTERREGCLVLREGLEALHTREGAGPISVAVRGLEWPDYLRAFRAHGLALFLLGWRPDYADPDDYVAPFLHSGGVFAARIRYVNRTLDGLIDAAASELNPTIRVKMYEDLTSRAVIDDVAYLWVYQSRSFHVERTWVRGYYFHPMLSGLDYHLLSKVTA
jgi:peptide/nickel transport system substrate-binding protein